MGGCPCSSKSGQSEKQASGPVASGKFANQAGTKLNGGEEETGDRRQGRGSEV